MITQRASFVAFVGFSFYLVAVVNELPAFYFALTWYAVGLLVSCFVTAWLSVAGLECFWKVSGERPSTRAEGADPESGPRLRLDLSNMGRSSTYAVNVEFCLRHFESGEVVPQRFQIQALPKGTSLDCTLTLLGLAPGHYRIEEVDLVGSDPFGLFRCKRRLIPDTLPEEIAVD